MLRQLSGHKKLKNNGNFMIYKSGETSLNTVFLLFSFFGTSSFRNKMSRNRHPIFHIDKFTSRLSIYKIEIVVNILTD